MVAVDSPEEAFHSPAGVAAAHMGSILDSSPVGAGPAEEGNPVGGGPAEEGSPVGAAVPERDIEGLGQVAYTEVAAAAVAGGLEPLEGVGDVPGGSSHLAGPLDWSIMVITW